MSLATPPVSEPVVRRMTVEEFAQLPDTGGLELDDGVVVEMKMGGMSSWIAGELHSRVRDFVRPNRLGWAFPQETAYECFPPTPSRVRKPDTSFVRAGRFPGEVPPEGYITLVPDLAAEVVSPNDTAFEVERKIRQFRQAGVRLVWVIYSETRTARVFHAAGPNHDVDADGHLDGEDVLPGFRLRLAELFPPEPPAAG